MGIGTGDRARWAWLVVSGAAAVCFVVLSAGTARAQDRDAPRLKTESPYFFVKSDDPALDRLPLKSTQVDVRISRVISDVTVVQRLRTASRHVTG